MMIYYLLGKKANIMGKGVEKREKWEIFIVLEGNSFFILEKGGGDAKISNFWEIYTPKRTMT